MKKERYDDHMVREHALDLQAPSVDEYSLARAIWIQNKEKSSPEELKVLTCDYDSDTGKRYSEDESESESYSEETSDSESDSDNTITNSDTGELSDTDITTHSDIENLSEQENQTDNDEDTPNHYDMNMETYQTSDDEEEDYSYINKYNLHKQAEDTIEQVKEITETIHEITEIIEINTNQTTKDILKHRADLSELESSYETIKSDRKSLNQQLKDLATNNRSSDVSPLDLVKKNIKKFEKMLHEETDKRISSQKILEKRSSTLESTLLAGKTSNILTTKTQHDPEVAVTNNKIDQINNHTGAKKSVVNSIKEDQPSENIHQLKITTAGDTSLHQKSDLKTVLIKLGTPTQRKILISAGI